jgi:hypothetical protein
MESPEGYTVTFTHNQTIGHLSRNTLLQQYRYFVLKMSNNGASMTSGLASSKIQGLCGNINP